MVTMGTAPIKFFNIISSSSISISIIIIIISISIIIIIIIIIKTHNRTLLHDNIISWFSPVHDKSTGLHIHIFHFRFVFALAHAYINLVTKECGDCPVLEIVHARH